MIKYAHSNKAVCRKKEQAYLADTSDDEDEFAGKYESASAVKSCNNVKDINLNVNIAIELPFNFRDSNINASKSELNSIFEESDIEVSTVITTDSEYNADSTSTYGETEWIDMSLDSEFDQDIESHLIYKEEYNVTYMVPVPKTRTHRDSSSHSHNYHGRRYHGTEEVKITT